MSPAAMSRSPASQEGAFRPLKGHESFTSFNDTLMHASLSSLQLDDDNQEEDSADNLRDLLVQLRDEIHGQEDEPQQYSSPSHALEAAAGLEIDGHNGCSSSSSLDLEEDLDDLMHAHDSLIVLRRRRGKLENPQDNNNGGGFSSDSHMNYDEPVPCTQTNGR